MRRVGVGSQDLRAGDPGKRLPVVGVTLRVAYARELVAAGHRPAVVARILQISRQAVYRVPRPRKPPDAARRPPIDDVERAIVEVAEQNPTDDGS